MLFKNMRSERNTTRRHLQLHKELLMASVQTHILPALIRQGFSPAQRSQADPRKDEKSLGTFPFGLLERRRHGGTTDLIEVQFMTYQRAAFRINACAVPPEGISTLGGHRSAGEIFAGGLHDHFEMYFCPRLRIWFSLWLWRFRKASSSDYDNLCLYVAGLLSELDRALMEGIIGPHIRQVRMPRVGLIVESSGKGELSQNP
jgi:hypothetical protein